MGGDDEGIGIARVVQMIFREELGKKDAIRPSYELSRKFQ